LAEQEKNRRDQRTGVTDTDPEYERNDHRTPENRMSNTQQTDTDTYYARKDNDVK
jgi:hypothetical protein